MRRHPGSGQRKHATCKGLGRSAQLVACRSPASEGCHNRAYATVHKRAQADEHRRERGGLNSDAVGWVDEVRQDGEVDEQALGVEEAREEALENRGTLTRSPERRLRGCQCRCRIVFERIRSRRIYHVRQAFCQDTSSRSNRIPWRRCKYGCRASRQAWCTLD
jgi:hypothetical protein